MPASARSSPRAASAKAISGRVGSSGGSDVAANHDAEAIGPAPPRRVRFGLLLATAVAIATPALAGTTGVYLPPAPTGSGGEDSIETSSGTRCRQSINSSGAYVDLGVAGTAGTPTDPRLGTVFRDTRDREATAYARVTIPIGPRPQRIDCSQVFELEIAKLKREVELLRMGAR